MLSKPCGELYCHQLAYCDMCGLLTFSNEYKLKVSRPQGAGAALCVLWLTYPTWALGGGLQGQLAKLYVLYIYLVPSLRQDTVKTISISYLYTFI